MRVLCYKKQKHALLSFSSKKRREKGWKVSLLMSFFFCSSLAFSLFFWMCCIYSWLSNIRQISIYKMVEGTTWIAQHGGDAFATRDAFSEMVLHYFVPFAQQQCCIVYTQQEQQSVYSVLCTARSDAITITTEPSLGSNVLLSYILSWLCFITNPLKVLYNN